MPRAVADALKAREMVARVVALSALSLVVGSLETGAPHPLLAAGRLAWAIGAGAALGAAIGWALVWLRERVEPAPVEIAVSIATPYLCSLGALWLGLSVVVVIMAAALTVAAVRVDRETGAPRTSAEARISAVAFWEEASLLVSSAMFFLAGRALPEAMAELNRVGGVAHGRRGGGAALRRPRCAVRLRAISRPRCRPWPRRCGSAKGEEGGAAKTRAATAALMAWACTRSVIGLVLALSLPPSLEDRGLVLVVAALLILGSVLLQGLTLRPAVLAAALCEEEEEKQEEELATRAANAAAERSGKGRTTSTPPGAPCSSCARRTGSATRRCARCCAKPTSRPEPPKARPRRCPGPRRRVRDSCATVGRRSNSVLDPPSHDGGELGLACAGRVIRAWAGCRCGSRYVGLNARTVTSSAVRPSASMVSAVVPWNRAKAWVARPTGVSAPHPNPSSAPHAHA